MQYLKQSTAIAIMFGPFVDKADGVTLKTDATTITDIDHASTGIFLSKNGEPSAIRHATVTASVADAYGMMHVHLDATDTNTLGQLDVLFAKAATYLPVHKSFMVLPANIYDSQIAGSVNQKVDVDTIKTQTVTCAAGVTVLASVGTAATSTAQTGDSFAVVKSGGTGDNAAIKTKTDFLPSATAGAAGGLQICGSNTATTYASLTCTGAFSINGVSNVSQTGDSFAVCKSGGTGDNAAIKTMTDKIGTITNTGGTATIGAILGDAANSSLITRIGDVHSTDLPAVMTMLTDIHNTDLPAVKTDTGNIVTKTNYLPSATAGAAGGVFIAGTNAATTITTALTTTFTGNLSGNVTGSVGSVTGAVGSVTGAVGSVTGAVGSVTGAVGSVTGLTASDVGAIKTNTDKLTFDVSNNIKSVKNATDLGTADFNATEKTSITTAATAATPSGVSLAASQHVIVDSGTVTTCTNLTNAPTNGDLTATMKASVTAAVPTVAGIADGVWDEATAGHQTAGTAGKALTDAGAAGTPPTAAAIADAVWDETTAGHSTGGTTGAAIIAAGSAGDPWSTSIPGAYGAGTAGKIVGDNLNAKVGDVKTQTDKMNFTGTDIKATLDGETVTASSVTDKTGYSLSVTPPTAADIKTAIEAGGSSLALIKAKTDNLPASPAAVGSNMGTVTGVSGNVTGSVGSVTAGVTVTTNNDKTGYTASTVSDKTGYALTSAYDPAKTAAQAGNAMTLTAAYDASKTAAQASTALSTAVWTSQKAGYLDAAISGIAASAVNLSIDGTKTSTIEADGHQITVG